MRAAGRAGREVLLELADAVKVGMTTDELDRICHEACIARGGYPSPLHYKGFPKSLCTSVNEVICHGIPDDRPLQDGDIVNCDVTIYLHGVHGDCNATFFVGDVDEQGRRLVHVTKEALWKAIDEVAGGLTEHECAALVALIREIRRSGVSIIWIEHVVHALVAVVDRLVVLYAGALIAEGEPRTVIQSPAVREIYMGIPADA